MRGIPAVFVAAIFLSGSGAQATDVSGLIGANTVWTAAGSPYVVTGNVLVNNGVILAIDPGVMVRFNSLRSLQIDGTLLARGTSSDNITFTSNTTDTAGSWGYIYFSDTSADAVFENDLNGKYLDGSILEYCVIQYAGGAGVANNGALRLDDAHPFVNYCTIACNGASGIRAFNLSGSLKITNSSICHNTTASEGAGIFIYNDPYTTGGNFVVSGNTISNNTATSAGGGIYSLYAKTITISNNILSGNTAKTGGGIYKSYHGAASISHNILVNNSAIDGQGGGGGVYIGNYGSASLSGNVIINNTASGNQFGGGGVLVFDQVSAGISNNIIADNRSTTSGGGIYSWSAYTIMTKNHIVRNTASDDAGIYCFNSLYDSIKTNTVTCNKNTDYNDSLNRNIYLTFSHPKIKNNNIFGNSAFYELFNDNAQGSPNTIATNNWWGTAVDAEIHGKIYDWFDTTGLGIVNYSPFLTTPDTLAPLSPPANVIKTDIGGGRVKITWKPNPEADVAGYRVYSGGFNGYSFINEVGAGSDTSYILLSASIADTIGVTAYDNTYSSASESASTIVNDNMTGGNESWYSYAVDTTTIGVSAYNGRMPGLYTLLQNYPNPFCASTTIEYRISTPSTVSLKIFDQRGREVAILVNEKKPAGSYSAKWNASALISGTYFYALEANGKRETRKMLLLTRQIRKLAPVKNGF